MLRRLFKRFWTSPAPSVDFYAATWIDEIWVRSAACAAKRSNFAVRMVISGDRTQWPADLEARYAQLDIPLVWAPSVEVLHGLAMRVVVTASSGIPRSYFGESLKRLIHMPHSLASLHVIYPPDAFDGYDTLFAAGPHHQREFQALGVANGLGDRASFPVGYGKFDVMSGEADAAGPADARHVLVAPSWGENNVLSLCGASLTAALVDAGWKVTLRPHPSFFVYPDGTLEAILDRFGDNPSVTVERSTGGSQALWTCSAMISDYSGIAMEFAALRRLPVVFVDGPRKILNPDWQRLGVPAAEIDSRDRFGYITDTRVDSIVAALERLPGEKPIVDDIVSDFLHRQKNVGETVAAHLKSFIPEVIQ